MESEPLKSIMINRRTMLTKVLKEVTGATNVEFHTSDDCMNRDWSYIDHQSHGTSNHAFESEEILKNFIFNPKSTLQTDNDNH